MDIFISYRRKNSTYAYLVYYALKMNGFSVFLDTTHSSAGYFPNYLAKRVNESSYFLLIIGPECLESKEGTDWYKEEIDIALERLANKEDIQIIPILTGGVKLDSSSWKSNWISFEKYKKIAELQSIIIGQGDNINDKIDGLIKLIKLPLCSTSLLTLLKKSVSDCQSQSILEYIIKSEEMNMHAGSQMQLLTDNLKNYDFSPIAKIAIANNISNNSKYIYYTPKSCEDEFLILKRSIGEYITRAEPANKEIDKWIKKKFLYNNLIVRSIANLSGLKKEHFDKNLPDSCKDNLLHDDVLGIYFKYDHNMEEIFSIDFFIDWLEGNSERNAEIDNCLLRIKKIKECIESEDKLKAEWSKCIQYLELVEEISDWVTMKNTDNLDSEAVQKNCRKFKVPQSVVQWLANGLPKGKNLEDILENIEHYVLSPADLPFIPCHSFSLFYDQNNQPIAGSWYTASNELSTNMLYDNMVTVHDCRNEDLTIIKNVFERLQAEKDKDKNKDKADSKGKIILKGKAVSRGNINSKGKAISKGNTDE